MRKSSHQFPNRLERGVPMSLHLTLAILAVGTLSTLAGTAARADEAEDKGLAIAQEADRRDFGFGDSESILHMTLTNQQGESSTRELRIKTLEVEDPNEGDKGLTIFDSPGDIRGTAFLSFTHINKPDDQWLFLPALKRVKRISSANKSGPFVGSEFAFEDLSSQEVAKYTYRWLRDEPCGDLQCFVVERYPVYENSGYTRQITWVDQDEYRILKIVFYDRKDSLLKTLTFEDYKQYLDQYWRAHKLTMVNHLTGKGTVLLFDEYTFRAGLRDRDFDKKALERAR